MLSESLQMIVLLLFLIVDGEPLRVLLLRRLGVFSDLDLIQICIINIFVSGLALYVLAMLPFRLFNWMVLFGFSVASLFFSVFAHRDYLKRFIHLDQIKEAIKKSRNASFDHVFVLGIFVGFLIINFVSINNLVFGSVRDESIHSLSVEVILENSQLPLTLRPYVGEGIIYPQASHIIFAYAACFLNMEVPKAVLYGSILFKSLSILGAYFLGKRLSARRTYSLGLSFVFAFISSWPLYVTWGGNPFIVGFPLFLVALGLLFSLTQSSKNGLLDLLSVGLIFGYTGAIMISYFQTLIVTMGLILVYLVVRKRDYFRRSLVEFSVVFSVGLAVFSPFLVRFFTFYGYPGHNIGIASDFSAWPKSQFYMTQALQWAFENLSPHLSLRIIMLLFLVGLGVLVWRAGGYQKVKSVIALALTIFLAALLLSFVSFLFAEYAPDFTVISWGHQGIIMSVPLSIVIVTFFARLAEFCQSERVKAFLRLFSKRSFAAMVLTVSVLSLTTAPFIYYRVFVDSGTVGGSYGLFAVTTQDDYNLMNWMKANLSTDAVILVNPYEAGVFIPSISHHRVVFPYSGSSYSGSYQTLVNLTRHYVLNRTTYELMRRWNVSHVFVGSNAAFWWLKSIKWDPKLFLGNPNFELVKNIGESYLFSVNYVNPNTAFLDNFEHQRWNENKWQTYYAGNGLGNVTITNGHGYNGTRCLRITTTSVSTVSEWNYMRWVYREVFVQNNSQVTLSFYADASSGFGGRDTFAVVISNIHQNRSVVVSTRNGIYKDYNHTILVDQFKGFFEFEGNQSLSAWWQRAFGEPFPDRFILGFVNLDFDGVENVAYIDNVTVTSTPSG